MMKITKYSVKFPHFPRSIAASVSFRFISYFLGLVMILILLVNIFQFLFFPVDEEKNLRYGILTDNKNSLSYEKLGRFLVDKNLKRATYEYQLAEKLHLENPQPPISNNNYLGLTTSPLDSWEKIINYQKNLQHEIDYWQKVKKTLPDYNFSYLKLTLLYYQLGQIKEGRSQLLELLQKDSTNNEAQTLLKKIEN